MHIVARVPSEKIFHSVIIKSNTLRFAPIIRLCTRRNLSNEDPRKIPFRKISLSEHKRICINILTDYSSSWEGFFDNLKTHRNIEHTKKGDENRKEKWKENLNILEEEFKKETTFAQDNFKKNVKAIVNEAQNTTNISTKDDLLKWIGEQMKVANFCLAEFTIGYRQGRDEEIERVMNEYFQDLDKVDGSEKIPSFDVNKLEEQLVKTADDIQKKAWDTVNNLLDDEKETKCGSKSKNKAKAKSWGNY